MKDLTFDQVTDISHDHSLLKTASYDSAHQVLEIEFAPTQAGNEATQKRQFTTFPQDKYDAFIAAEDPDLYYRDFIQGLHPMTRP